MPVLCTENVKVSGKVRQRSTGGKRKCYGVGGCRGACDGWWQQLMAHAWSCIAVGGRRSPLFPFLPSPSSPSVPFLSSPSLCEGAGMGEGEGRWGIAGSRSSHMVPKWGPGEGRFFLVNPTATKKISSNKQVNRIHSQSPFCCVNRDGGEWAGLYIIVVDLSL